MTTRRNILIGLMILISARLSAEPIGDIISYQGKLTNPDGTPVANGKHSVSFKIYANGSDSGYSQTMEVNTIGGVFAAFLSVGALSFDPSKGYELGIAADGGGETKHQIASVPVAKIAQNAAVAQYAITSERLNALANVSLNGHDIENVIRVRAPANENLDIYPGEGSGGINLAYGMTGRAVYVGGNGSVNLSVSGKGTFNGGVASDMRGQGAVTAIAGESDGIGVRGYSAGGQGTVGETANGVAVMGIANSNGDVFRGLGNGGAAVARIDSTGKGFFNGGTQTGGADYADLVTVHGAATDYEPGDVLVIGNDPEHPFTKTVIPYSKNVAGIYSTKPGVVGSKHGIEPAADNEVPLALTGIVPCKVSCENGPIRMGDLLVTSRSPGYAMKGTNPKKLTGAVLGKALQPLASGKGMIEVLVVQR